MADIIRELEKEQLRTDLPKLEVGDTVRVGHRRLPREASELRRRRY